jgi:hypothetical protein
MRHICHQTLEVRHAVQGERPWCSDCAFSG